MSNNVVPEAQVLQTTAFGELEVAQKDPEIQVSAQYDSLLEMKTLTSGGTAEASNGEFIVTSGTGSSGFGTIFTDRQIISRPGQGSEIIYTARFTDGVVDNQQTSGPSTSLDSIFFGFDGVEYGVFFNHNGAVIIEELTITTPAAGAESTTITIDGTAYTVPLTIGNGTVEHNAFEIAASLNTQVPLFRFTQNEATVVCRSLLAAPEVGAFTFSSPGAAVATWIQIADGVTTTQEFTKESDWSEGAVFELPVDPIKLNRYKIVLNGSIEYYIEDGTTGDYQLVHKRIHTNVEITPIFSVASFRISWNSINTGNTTDITVAGTEGAAFNQGERAPTKETFATFNTAVGIDADATNILTIRCREVFGTKVNLGRIIPLVMSAFTDGMKGAIVQGCINMDFAAEPNFSYIDKDNSIAEVETSPILVTGGKCIFTLVIGASASVAAQDFKNVLLPGDTLTIAMNVPSAAAADMNASITWEEDL